MTQYGAPMCMTCRHKAQGALRCTAFPTGIPVEIYTSAFDHRLPHPDDGGVQYQLLDGAEPFGLAEEPLDRDLAD